jgi:hypothetical protein
VRLGELLETLVALGARVYIGAGGLGYSGPRLRDDNPLQVALAAFHDEVYWLLQVGRLCLHCPRLLADGDRICCEVHRDKRDASRLVCDTTPSGAAR